MLQYHLLSFEKEVLVNVYHPVVSVHDVMRFEGGLSSWEKMKRLFNHYGIGSMVALHIIYCRVAPLVVGL